MPNQGIVNIGLQVDYQKSLDQMTKAFRQTLTEISNEVKKSDYDANLTKKIDQVEKKMSAMEDSIASVFNSINNQKLDSSKFSDFENHITKSISSIVADITLLKSEIKGIKGSDIVSGLIEQLNNFKQGISDTFPALKELLGLIETSTGVASIIDPSSLKETKALLGEIKKTRKELDNIEGSFSKSSDNELFDKLLTQEEILKRQVSTCKKLETELSSLSGKGADVSSLDRELAKAQMAAIKTAGIIEELDAEIQTRFGNNGGASSFTRARIRIADGYDEEVDKFVTRTNEMIETSKNAQKEINTFQIKNGTIHVPIEITDASDVKKQISEIIAKAQTYADGKTVIAKVKLVLDGEPTNGYKKNSDIAKQIEEGQGEPAIDISKAIKKTYTQAVREAEQIAKDSINAIQAKFKEMPVKVTFDKDAFISELTKTVNSSIAKVAKDTTGVNVNSELGKLVEDLQKMSGALAGVGSFDLGIDEEQINRITSAIENMANMIQRAFGVASDADIAKQWGVIEDKFKATAGEEGKLLKAKKEHKAAMHEIVVEYQKYLDMGGKNDLSALTKHNYTVKNLRQAHEDLGKAAEEAARKQQQAAKAEPSKSKDSSQEKEAIEGINTENKKLETQAGKTSTALENEGKVAQSTAKKFKKLAEEKAAAVKANENLAQAAKETADALTKEAKAKKERESAGKPSKNAVNTGGASPIIEQYKELKRVAKEMSGLNKKIAGLDSERDAAQVARLENQLVKLRDTYAQLYYTVQNSPDIHKLPTDALSNIDNIVRDASQKIDVLRAKARDAAKKLFDDFSNKHKDSPYFTEIQTQVDQLKNSIANINDQNSLNNFKQELKSLETILANISKNSKLGEIVPGSKVFNNINEVRQSIDSLFSSIGKVNEKSIRVSGTDKLTADVKTLNGEIHRMSVSLDTDGFARYVDNGIVQFGRLRDSAESIFKSIAGMVRIYLTPYSFVRYFKQGFDAVKDVDVAITELRKVSDASLSDIASYFGKAVSSAKELGSSVEDMISATADWARLGYSLPDAKKLGEIAVLYKNVGDGINVEAANESLVSTLQGFQLEASDAENIIDKFNEVSNNFAISSGGIGEALKRSAAAFNAANTDLSKSIALVTSTNEVIQNPEKVGTLYQTLSARIRGSKTELEEMGADTDDLVESTSKLRDLVKGITGFDIMKDKDTYKDIYEIILGISTEWSKINDIDRAALLEALAGKRQSNALAAVLNNSQHLVEAYETAENSAGSAMREQAKYQESIQYSLDQMTAHAEEFWNTFYNKKDVKIIIDIINGIINGLTKITDLLGAIPTIGAGAGILAAFKNFGRPKMFGLEILTCFEIAEYRKCSFGYESFLAVSSAIHYSK